MFLRKILLLLICLCCSQVAYAQLAVTGSIVNESCAGNDGAISISVTGGSPPYIFTWSNGAGTSDISGLSAGNYTLTVRDQTATSVTRTFYVAGYQQISVYGNITNAGCASGGSIDLWVYGGVAPYTYRWSNGATTEDISGLAEGTYGVSVVDRNGCSTNAYFTVQAPPRMQLTFTKQDAGCSGATGSINLSVSGGQSPYTYRWSNGATTEDLTGIAAGTYTVFVTDAAGCSMDDAIPVGSSNSISLSATRQDVQCAGQSTGAVNLSVSGGMAPYSYRWSNGTLSEDLTGVAAGTYSVTVTDAANCSATLSVQVTAPAQPIEIVPTITPAIACIGGANGSIRLQASGGTAPYTYRWTDGTTTANRYTLRAGSYQVVLTDASGCTATATAVVPLDENVPLLTLASTPNDACDAISYNGVITASVTFARSYSYKLYKEQATLAGASGATTSSLSFTGLASGTYRLQIIQENGCSVEAEVQVGEQQLVPVITGIEVIPQTNCDPAAANGRVQVTGVSVDGGSSPVSDFMFTWQDAAGNYISSTSSALSNVPAGVYQVTATKVNGNSGSGCQSAPFQVAVPYAPVYATIALSSTPNTACSAAHNGSIQASISAPTAAYSWSWKDAAGAILASGTEATSPGLAAMAPGRYELIVVPANGCATTESVDVLNEIASYSITYQKGDVSCAGENNAWIQLETAADFDYYLSKNGEALVAVAGTGTIEALAPGVYTVEATNRSTACVYTTTITIGEPAPLALIETVQQLSAAGATDGSISLVVAGGTAPYAYLWSNAASSSEISGLVAGIYTVTVTDAQGCTLERSFVIDPKELLGVADKQNDGLISATKTVSGQLLVKFTGTAAAQELRLYRLDGSQVVQASLAGKQEAVVQVPAAAPAVYLLLVTTKEHVYKKKILF